MTEQKVSHRYARAVLEAAVAEKCEDQVHSSFVSINNVIGSSKELRTLLANPVVLPIYKKKIFSEIFEGKVHALNYMFLSLLIDKNRETLIPSIIVQFDAQYNLLKNRVYIEIHSANELDESAKKSILDKLSKWTKKTVLPVYKIDKSLRGGVLVRIGDWVYDCTIKNQLHNLYKRLAEE